MRPWEYREEVHGRAYQPPPEQASDNESYHPPETFSRRRENQEEISRRRENQEEMSSRDDISAPGESVTLPLTLDQEAAKILAELRPEPLTPSQWLDLAEAARLEAVATFPPERQHNALTSYLASYCEGKPAQLIAAHAVALYLWARRGRAVPIGHCHDAACNALELEADSLSLNRPIPKRGRR